MVAAVDASSPGPMDPGEKNKNVSDEDPTVVGSRSATWRW